MLNRDIIHYPLPHYSARHKDAKLQAIIVHCIGMYNVKDALAALDQYQVSAHYLVPNISALELYQQQPELFLVPPSFPDEAPIIQLVEDRERARHAGVSAFSDSVAQAGCLEGMNDITIGIEFLAPGYANGDGSDLYVFTDYPKLQQRAGIELLEYLTAKHNIPKENILAHSTIAPDRKTDPGPRFFWDELFSLGFGYLPKPITPPIDQKDPEAIRYVQQQLYAIGFNTCPQTAELDPKTQLCIDAYIMQFASHLWRHKNNPLSQELLTSLASCQAPIIKFELDSE